jgi:hypothetical protein
MLKQSTSLSQHAVLFWYFVNLLANLGHVTYAFHNGWCSHSQH